MYWFVIVQRLCLDEILQLSIVYLLDIHVSHYEISFIIVHDLYVSNNHNYLYNNYMYFCIHVLTKIHVSE